MAAMREALADYLNAQRVAGVRRREAAPYIAAAKEAEEAVTSAANRLQAAWTKEPSKAMPLAVRYGCHSYLIRWDHNRGLVVERAHEVK